MGVALSALALSLALATGGSIMEAAAAPAAPGVSTQVAGKQCPVKEIKKVWYGGESTKCPNLRDRLDHLFYPGRQFSTALRDSYRENVVFIQLRLFDTGHQRIVVDGYYGDLTRRVVKNYQRRHGLVVDGKVGLQTWKSLFGLGRA
jgi:murein L,D-transpeptidase YcbB/YkuD